MVDDGKLRVLVGFIEGGGSREAADFDDESGIFVRLEWGWLWDFSVEAVCDFADSCGFAVFGVIEEFTGDSTEGTWAFLAGFSDFEFESGEERFFGRSTARVSRDAWDPVRVAHFNR